ncbi:MAG: helix-turn-helix domain-containing protein [Clostridia bacterium]|nr:helix-turn-helix domain-containing protein [Clostridia bacterium]MBR4576516.1 helix-turn-helix domain-containing protein [Clostridia bacterium]
MTMGERIKYLRESIGMTQDELGEKIGVQKSAIVKYEKGKVENIKRSAIKTMAEIFNVSPCYLMGFDEDEDEIKTISKQVALLQAVQDQWGKDSVKMLELFTGLNSDGQKKALNQLEDLSEIPKYRKDDDS